MPELNGNSRGLPDKRILIERYFGAEEILTPADVIVHLYQQDESLYHHNRYKREKRWHEFSTACTFKPDTADYSETVAQLGFLLGHSHRFRIRPTSDPIVWRNLEARLSDLGFQAISLHFMSDFLLGRMITQAGEKQPIASHGGESSQIVSAIETIGEKEIAAEIDWLTSALETTNVLSENRDLKTMISLVLEDTLPTGTTQVSPFFELQESDLNKWGFSQGVHGGIYEVFTARGVPRHMTDPLLTLLLVRTQSPAEAEFDISPFVEEPFRQYGIDVPRMMEYYNGLAQDWVNAQRVLNN